MPATNFDCLDRLYGQEKKILHWQICSIKGLSFGSKNYTKELKTVECTSLSSLVNGRENVVDSF